jgi:antitoxin VapB
MPLNIRSDEVNRLAARLAVRKHVSKTEAVKVALENELRRVEEQIPLWDRLKPLRDKVAAYPDTGLEADKTFYDELSGEY